MLFEVYSSRARKAVLAFAMLCVLALFSPLPASALQNVILNWNPSTNSSVAGYNIYYGTQSQVYTNMIPVGNVTAATISNLVEGVTYYFSAKSHDASTNQSPFSNETSYDVSASPTNSAPTLDTISNLTLDIGAETQEIILTNITSGLTNAKPHIKVTAFSDFPTLIRPGISYSSPNNNGKLKFKPAANRTGTATITVVVNNGAKSNNTATCSFTVTVTNAPPTIDPIANMIVVQGGPEQKVVLTGITSGSTNEHQRLKVTAVSSVPSLVRPSIKYSSPKTNGLLMFKPSAKTNGVATIFVTVNDGNLSVTNSFTVTVQSGVANSVVGPGSTTLLIPLGMGDGSFGFQVSGSPGLYAVQVSSDLAHWTPIQTNSIPSGNSSFIFTDTNVVNVEQRFYRTAFLNN